VSNAPHPAIPFVDLAASVRANRDEYLAAIAKIMDAGAFVGGAAVTELEAAFARFCGTPTAAVVGSGTTALLLALRALDVGPGDEVITAANSFFATAEAVSLTGATPVLCDVREDTLLIDVDDAARRVTKRTKAIIPVHLFGQIACMDRVLGLAAAHGLKVLEDSAQAHGAARVGPDGATWRPGSTGDVAAFSFYPTKNLGAFGDGGAVVSRDPAIVARVQRLRDHGQAGRHDHVEVGYNARLSAMQAACLAISLRSLDERNAARRALAARYRAGLADVPGIRLVTELPGSTPVYHLMVIRVDRARRDAIMAALGKEGINTAIHYPRPIHLQKAYASLGQGPGSCPVAEAAAEDMISLPMYPELPMAWVERVIERVRIHVAG
jgi:dTDP-4-amino-4,6-dideoxygalactose transaminase